LKLQKRIYPKVEVSNQNQQIPQSIEDEVQGGSGCVASMSNVEHPRESQKELNLNDVMNSQMVSKAVELFQPESQIRIKPKV